MDAADAKELLQRIKQAGSGSSPQFTGLTGLMPSFGSDPVMEQKNQQIQQQDNARLQADAVKTILKTVLMAGGVGAAVRGYAGLNSVLAGRKRKRTGRTTEMPVAYPEKSASNDQATSMIGLDYFIPSMLLGTPLAAYGGWKGVDALLNRQREKATDDELQRAKSRYAQALLGAYKQATDAALDVAFHEHEKQSSWFSEALNSAFPNASGMAKGLALSYVLGMTPLGYSLVDNVMKKNSKRALLQKAVEERARRQAMTQPPDIYAVPTPVEPESASDGVANAQLA